MTMTTSPTAPVRRDYRIDGIRVEQVTPAVPPENDRPPVIFVHGGCHASWCWEDFAPVFAAAGWDTHALNWRGRNGSDALPLERFVQMSIADVVDDIAAVATQFDVPPVLVGHSMGGLASQLYAARHPVAALALMTPVVPSNVAAEPIELPVEDMHAPWGPPPPEQAHVLFFQGLSAAQAARVNALLVPESPRRVIEATRWTLPVDAAKITAPVLVVAGALDVLTPPQTGQALAELYRAKYQLEPAHGHNVLLGAGATNIATRVLAWLGNVLQH